MARLVKDEVKTLPSNMATQIVAEYLELKTLNDMGYKQDLEDLMQWEVEAFGIIGSEFSKADKKKLDELKLKKPKGKRR